MLVLTLILTLAMLLAGCGGSVDIPANLRTPSIVGVVEASTRLANGNWSYRLKSGQTIEVDHDQTTSLLGGPSVDRLLLAGEDPDGRHWVAGVSGDWPGRPPGCFLFPGQGRASGGWIETNSGFRLPKAADFTDARDNPDDEFASDRWGLLSQ